MLRTEPSFSIYNSDDGVVEKNREEEIIAALGSPQFSFGRNSSMSKIREDDEEDEILSESQGLEMDGEGVDCGGDVEGYYEKMSKGNVTGAEDCCDRATLADPTDSKTALLYAKLSWECHHDKDRAHAFFKRAINASPEDSDVLAAYAKFLWEIDEDEDEDEDEEESSMEDEHVEDNGGHLGLDNLGFAEEPRPASPPLHLASGLGIDVAGLDNSFGASSYMTLDFDDDVNMEEYIRMMAETNPASPLYLRRYAEFLHQVKGDLKSAKEYYSRAVLADPSDGEVLSQYAQLILDLYSNRQRASFYFQQAVQVAPDNSNVLAAHARFLWEAEDDDEEQDTA